MQRERENVTQTFDMQIKGMIFFFIFIIKGGSCVDEQNLNILEGKVLNVLVNNEISRRLDAAAFSMSVELFHEL